MRWWIFILLILLAVSASAAADGLMDEGIKMWGHAIGSAETFLLIILGVSITGWRRAAWLIAAYICWRIVAFDYIYNLTRGLPWDYAGTTSLWDAFISKQQPVGLLFGRLVFLVVAIAIPIKNFKAMD